MDFDSFVLAASTADLTDAGSAARHADCVEFRMDMAADPLAALEAYGGPLPVLATNRAAWEGGAAGEEGRLEDLEAAIDTEWVEAIDVEMASIHEGDADGLLETAAARDVAVVASAHDFEGTPSAPDMVALLERAAAVGDVGKLAVTATDRSDTMALLSATHEATSAGHTVATMAMGEPGSHTRAVAPLYGSRIGYAPLEAKAATAPGQYDLETLSGLIGALESEKRDS